MSALSREERGLPHHPCFGWLACPDCDGAGEFEQSRGAADPNPRVWTCDRCRGDGYLWDSPCPEDPLLQVRRSRSRLSGEHWLYDVYRKQAMKAVRLPRIEYVKERRAAA